MPGFARRQLTFFASPKKVSKERRPGVRRRAKARGSLRYSRTKAAAELVGRICTALRRGIVASSSNRPRRLPLRSLRCSATLNGNSRARLFRVAAQKIVCRPGLDPGPSGVCCASKALPRVAETDSLNPVPRYQILLGQHSFRRTRLGVMVVPPRHERRQGREDRLRAPA
jgi:hypothetical protein